MLYLHILIPHAGLVACVAQLQSIPKTSSLSTAVQTAHVQSLPQAMPDTIASCTLIADRLMRKCFPWPQPIDHPQPTTSHSGVNSVPPTDLRTRSTIPLLKPTIISTVRSSSAIPYPTPIVSPELDSLIESQPHTSPTFAHACRKCTWNSAAAVHTCFA
jgi:hypothetical protein